MASVLGAAQVEATRPRPLLYRGKAVSTGEDIARVYLGAFLVVRRPRRLFSRLTASMTIFRPF